jgi:disulfide bond formation protein DsbB
MRTLRLAPLLILVASVGALATALGAQYLGGLPPCPLCLWQRWPYVATAAIGLAALALAPAERAQRMLVGLAGLVFLGGAGIAAFHVGVEAHWWPGLAECSGAATLGAQSIEELRASLLATPAVPCDAVPWSLFGISIAGYNLIAALALAAASLTAATARSDA